ncbi:MAG TPA: tail fiber domain-containing protein [Cyclobacteriaceae bacterium]
MKILVSTSPGKLARLFAICFLLSAYSLKAQQSMSIGTTTVKNNAVLYLVSQGKNQGLIVPIVSNKSNVTPDVGMVVYDESDNKLYYRDNANWVTMSGASGSVTLGGDLSGAATAATVAKLQGKTLSASSPVDGQILKYNGTTQAWELSTDAGAVYTAGTGITITSNQVSISNDGVTTTQIAPNTITNADLNKTTIPLSGFGAATASVDLGSQKITNLAAPTATTDATTKAYVDAADATKLSSTSLTTAGDILYHDGTSSTRLARGTTGQVLQSTATSIQWTTPTVFTNPMTTTGDLITGGASGTPTRLAGATGFLKSTGAATPAWSAVNLSGTDVTSTLPLANGGTGATTAAAARTNLGLGTLSTLNAVNLSSTDVTSTLPLANGGTGATTAAAARTNLGLGTLSTLSTVTTTEITDGTIVDADVSATAAISGKKINPDFGTQDILTTGRAGLGLAVGNERLNIKGTDNSFAAGVRLEDDTNAAEFGDILCGSEGLFYHSQVSGNNHYFLTSQFSSVSNPALIILDNGNVGVGTSAPSTNWNVSQNVASITPMISVDQLSTTGDASMKFTTTTNSFSVGTNSTGSFKISNSTALGTNDHFEITPGVTDASTIPKVFMDLGPRGQDGVLINSNSAWGTSLAISNGTATTTGNGYAMTVTGPSGPTSQANDFAMMRGLAAVMTIGYNSAGGFYNANFPSYTFFGTTPMRLGVNLASGTAPGYNLEISGSAGKSTGTAWINTSDIRLKKDVSRFTDGLNVISKINPIWFRYNGKGGTKPGEKLQVGIVAQELKEIAPYTVGTFKAKYDETSPGEETFYNFDYNAIGYALINAVKELDNKVKSLEAENSLLKKQLQEVAPPSGVNDQSLKAELQTQKARTDLLETELKEIKRLLSMEAKQTSK